MSYRHLIYKKLINPLHLILFSGYSNHIFRPGERLNVLKKGLIKNYKAVLTLIKKKVNLISYYIFIVFEMCYSGFLQ